MVGIQKFLDHTLFCAMDDVRIFGQMKGLMEIHNPGKFHQYCICGCQVKYFQSLSYQQKVGFRVAFGSFFMDYNAKSSPICTKISPVMQCKVRHQICYGFFYVILKIFGN